MDLSRSDELVRLARRVGVGSMVGRDDAELLGRFLEASDREAGEAAFAALVDRHAGPLTRIARRVLVDPHASEDVVQATFLVLARSASSIRIRARAGPWLRGVAIRLALRERVRRARIGRAERRAARERSEVRPASMPDPDGPALLAEVGRLDARWREPILLCDVLGLTQKEAAEQLGWPLGTLKVRHMRGRTKLADRLKRRGFGPPAAAVVLAPPLATSPSRTAEVAASAFRIARGDLLSLTPAVAHHLRSEAMRKLGFRLGSLAAVTVACGAIALAAGPWDSPPGPSLPPDPPPRPASAKRTEAVQVDDPLRSIPVPAPAALRAVLVRARFTFYDMEKFKEIEARADEAAGGRPATLNASDLPKIQEDVSWPLITGTIDHSAVVEEWKRRIGSGDDHPDRLYRRVELARRERGPGGDWSDWGPVDRQATWAELNNCPHMASEGLPGPFRPDRLADFLPFVEGYDWSATYPEAVLRQADDVAGSDFGSLTERLEQVDLLIRCFDSTAEEGKTYRYRARIVIEAPIRGPEARELPGPWSEPTEAVSITAP